MWPPFFSGPSLHMAYYRTPWYVNQLYKGFNETIVTFNLDPPKIGSPRNEFFWNIWTHSEKFVPTVDQPHQGKSVHVNSHEVITKDISSVHRGIFWTLSDWSSSVCLDWPYTPLTKIFAQCTRNWMQRAVPPGMRLLNCVLLNLRAWIVSRNLNNLPIDKPLVQTL